MDWSLEKEVYITYIYTSCLWKIFVEKIDSEVDLDSILLNELTFYEVH